MRLLALVTLLIPSAALASPDGAVPSERLRFIGMQADVGVPDGGALGVVVRPTHWLRLGAAYTHNGFAGGVRGAVTLDPVNFPLAPTLTLEGGHTFEGAVRGQWLGIRDDVRVRYNYANLHLGIELGLRNSTRVFLRGGASVIDLDVRDFQQSDNVTVRGVDARVSLVGSAKLGFATFW